MVCREPETGGRIGSEDFLWRQEVCECQNPTQMWRTVNSLISGWGVLLSDSIAALCLASLAYFIYKVENMRQ